MPTSDKHFSDFLPPPSDRSFFMAPITTENFYKYILSLKPKGSLDDNNFSVCLISSVALPISIPLAHIFNLSISSGIFPSHMKVSRCIPIYKSGSIFDIENYRGIVIINAFNKVFEKIISDRLLDFLDTNNFLSKLQFGFRRKTSTTHAITAILNTISQKLNEGNYVMIVLLDIKKCFDSLSRPILFKKLENAGVRGIALDWFISYFLDRKQCTFVIGTSSLNILDILYGVLQGSVLGVLLFLIYINDLPESCEILINFLFADDDSAVIAAKNLIDLINSANSEIYKLTQWYSSNLLTIHPGKTKCLVFRGPRTDLNLYEHEPSGKLYLPLFLNLNNSGEHDISKIIPINLVPNPTENSACLLGILIDKKLSFKQHFNHLHNKVNKAIFSLRQMKHLLDKKHLTLLYNSYLKSAIEYGCLLFCCANKTSIKSISILQKKSIRILTNSGYRDHTAPLFAAENLLTFNSLIFLNQARFMYDYTHNLLPPFFSNTWRTNDQVHIHALRNSKDIYLETINKPFVNCHPLYHFPKVWNSCPTAIRESTSRKIFVNKLTKYLLDFPIV